MYFSSFEQNALKPNAPSRTRRDRPFVARSTRWMSQVSAAARLAGAAGFRVWVRVWGLGF